MVVVDSRRFVAQRLQQAAHAVGAGGGADQHRTDEAVAQFLGEVVEDLVARRRDVLEQLLHQLVVVIGERLQHLETRFFLAIEVDTLEIDDLGRRVLLVDIGPLEREIGEAGDRFVGPDRDLPQQQRHARRRLQRRERLAHALVDLVDLVEKQDTRDLELFEFAQDQLQLRDFLFVGLADHDGRIDRRQHRAHVVQELDRARTVDERVGVVHVRGGGDRELDAHAMMAGLFAGVAHRGSRLHRALARDGAGACEDRFEQRGLAALKRAHQRDTPWTRSSCAVLCHIRLPATEMWPSSGPDNHRFKPWGGLARAGMSGMPPPRAMRRSHAF